MKPVLTSIPLCSTLTSFQLLLLNQRHYLNHGGRPDVLDIILYKDINITDEPHSIHALDSDHNPIYFKINQLHTPKQFHLPPIKTTEWQIYRQTLSDLLDPRLSLNNNHQTGYSNCYSGNPSDHHLNQSYYSRTFTWVLTFSYPSNVESKLWQRTRHLVIKPLLNKLHKLIKNRIKRINTYRWNEKLQQLDSPNHEFWRLCNKFTKQSTSTTSHPIRGLNGLVFSYWKKHSLCKSNARTILT